MKKLERFLSSVKKLERFRGSNADLHEKQNDDVGQTVDELVTVVGAADGRRRRRRKAKRRFDERRDVAGEKFLAQNRNLNPEHEHEQEGLDPAADVTCKLQM